MYQWHVKPWVVKLEPDELTFAGMVADARSGFASGAGIKAKHGAAKTGSAEGRELDLVGAIGEIALAKATNLYWYPMVGYDPDVLDVGGLLDVRATRHKTGRLRIDPEDKDHVPYVLALVQEPYVKLAGYLLGAEAKQERFWETRNMRNPQFMVPQKLLLPMDGIVIRRVSDTKVS